MAYIDHHILRLMHFDNLEHILKHGMYSKNSGHVIPNYVNIGDTTLIKQRETFTVRIDPPNGNLGDYIPFYFAGPTNCICGLIVLTPEQEERAKAIQQQTGTNIPIYVDNKRRYFYP